MNDTKTLSRPSQSAMGPLSTSVLTNKIVNPMNVGISSYNRQFNYFDNDLLTAHSTEKYDLNPTLYYIALVKCILIKYSFYLKIKLDPNET